MTTLGEYGITRRLTYNHPNDEAEQGEYIEHEDEVNVDEYGGGRHPREAGGEERQRFSDTEQNDK